MSRSNVITARAILALILVALGVFLVLISGCGGSGPVATVSGPGLIADENGPGSDACVALLPALRGVSMTQAERELCDGMVELDARVRSLWAARDEDGACR